MTADRGHCSFVAIAEGSWWLAVEGRPYLRCDIRRALDRDWCHLGKNRPILSERCSDVSDGEHMRCPRDPQRFIHHNPTALDGRDTEPFCQRVRLHARCPDGGVAGNRSSVSETDSGGVHLGHRGTQQDLDSPPFERKKGLLLQRLGEGTEQRTGRLDQDDSGLPHVDSWEVPGQHSVEQLCHAACQLDTRGSTAHDRDGEQAFRRNTIQRVSVFERIQDASLYRVRVGKRLQSKCVLVDTRNAKGIGDRTACHDQVVERDIAPVLQRNCLIGEANIDDCSKPHPNVALSLEDPAGRITDVVAVKARRRDLVQQRLEGVVVALVNDLDVDGRVVEMAGDRESAESGPNNHHASSTLSHETSLRSQANRGRPGFDAHYILRMRRPESVRCRYPAGLVVVAMMMSMVLSACGGSGKSSGKLYIWADSHGDQKTDWPALIGCADKVDGFVGWGVAEANPVAPSTLWENRAMLAERLHAGDRVVVALGSNDLGDLDPPFAWDVRLELQSILQKRGAKVIWATLPPLGPGWPLPLGRDEAERRRTAWNGWIRSLPKDQQLDISSVLGDSLQPADDYGDGVHLNEEAQRRIADYAKSLCR